MLEKSRIMCCTKIRQLLSMMTLCSASWIEFMNHTRYDPPIDSFNGTIDLNVAVSEKNL